MVNGPLEKRPLTLGAGTVAGLIVKALPISTLESPNLTRFPHSPQAESVSERFGPSRPPDEGLQHMAARCPTAGVARPRDEIAQEFPVRLRRPRPAEASTSSSGLIAQEVEALPWTSCRDPVGAASAATRPRQFAGIASRLKPLPHTPFFVPGRWSCRHGRYPVPTACGPGWGDEGDPTRPIRQVWMRPERQSHRRPRPAGRRLPRVANYNSK